jgi:hypothetical protein
MIISVIILLTKSAHADDPGARDSIIVETAYVPFGETSVNVPIYAVTDENVAFYNIPLNWQSDYDGITPTEIYYYNYLFHWSVFDAILYDENIISMYGFVGTNYLNTYGNRLISWSILFDIDSTAPPQIIEIDSTYYDVAGGLSLGLSNGSRFAPEFLPGFIYYGNTSDIQNYELNQPSSIASLQNYPNPFNASTTIEFNLPEAAHVDLSVYNILGQKVTTLMDGRKAAGNHTITWDAGDEPSGVYLARLQSSRDSKSVKMILLK